MRTLVAGWFSFDRGAATAGDLASCEVVCDWLDRLGRPYDIAVAPPFSGGVSWRLVDPSDYTHVIFVCGPFQPDLCEREFVARFAGCRLFGLNLSMPTPLEQWNPFHRLWERDSSRENRPDLAFLWRQQKVPVVGVCLVEPDMRAMDDAANAGIQRLLASREVSVVLIDTRLDANITGLRTVAEVESLIARMDVLVTTRLHGAVLALKNGVPPLVIEVDSRSGKLRRHMEAVGWPVILFTQDLDEGSLSRAFDYCLTEAARTLADACCQRAVGVLGPVEDQFASEMSGATSPGAHRARVSRVEALTTKVRTSDSPRFRLDTYPHTYRLPPTEAVGSPEGRWLLRVADGNAGHIVLPSELPEHIRIVITRSGTAAPYDIQLNRLHLMLVADAVYVLSLSVRADASRPAAIGVARAEEPWTNLGLFTEVQLTPGWQRFEWTFTATATSENARIHFDVGGCSVPVEVKEVSLCPAIQRAPKAS